MILFAVLSVLAIGLYWTSRRICYNPLPYRFQLDPAFHKYWLILIGTSEAEITRRLGQPEVVLHASKPHWREHIEMRRRGDFAPLPTHAPTDRVLLYIGASGEAQTEVYYFIDETGHLKQAFVSEN